MREHEIYRQRSSASDSIRLLSRNMCSSLPSKPKGGTMDCKPRESRNASAFHAALTRTGTRTQVKFTVRIMDERMTVETSVSF